MATLTSTKIASTVQPRQVHTGLQAVHATFNSGATKISDSATTIYMVKVPHGAVVYDVICRESDGAATKATTDIGVVGALNAFGSGAGGAVFRATQGIPRTVSATTTGYEIFTATPTSTSSTTSIKVDLTVIYAMDEATDTGT